MQKPLDDSSLPEFLRKSGLLPAGERVSVEPAGEGNINWVRRARLGSGHSWVIKQARPALERFPEYRVSTERIRIEARYYETVADLDSMGLCPAVEHFDDSQRVLVLEDLGGAERFDEVLARGADVAEACRALGSFLGSVHRATAGDASLPKRFANDEMRRLHGDHIFLLPYRPNEFPLSPRIAERAAKIQHDRGLVARIDASYARYLEPRGALIHADVQPTNILLQGAQRGTSGRPRLLDPEIAHVGDPAFDVGILLAHLLLHGIARGEIAGARSSVADTWTAYAEAHGAEALASFADTTRYAGIELLRRTIGAARTPWSEQEPAALALLDLGVALVRTPPGTLEELALIT